MKLAVYIKDAQEEEPVRLLLNGGHGQGFVSLIAVDRKGQTMPGGHILNIGGAGHIVRIGNVNPDLGFKLDEERKIIFV